MRILGGEYAANYDRKGGVLAVSDGSHFTVQGGTFYANSALLSGGVAAVSEEGSFVIHGGTYLNNTSESGEVFASEWTGNISVRKHRGRRSVPRQIINPLAIHQD